MEALTGLALGMQLVFTAAAAVYFISLLSSKSGGTAAVKHSLKKEMNRLNKLRAVKLTEPLTEKARPGSINEIVGQEKAIAALRAALCGPNPRHVLIYGPPGVGKTTAARIILEEARKAKISPFGENAPFIEIDAATLQYDERSIADPLIGSVHDPIYQGAGAFGAAGIPQPKAGAVTKAHGGVLFLDEIGELNQTQMNKLLKVLEDRKVYFTSPYYLPEDSNIPKYIHDVFKNGFPADFRLIGATTRRPEELPFALRSRCAEVFFDKLNNAELEIIAENALKKSGFLCGGRSAGAAADYSKNGRDAVAIIQTAASVAALAGRKQVTQKDVYKAAEFGRYCLNIAGQMNNTERIGVAYGLGLCLDSGTAGGVLVEIEAVCRQPGINEAKQGLERLRVTGAIEYEEINGCGGKLKLEGAARSSVDIALTALENECKINISDYVVHVNFISTAPVNGSSAGAAVFAALYSAVTQAAISSKTAITGEITLLGKIRAVGGISEKIEAAVFAGAERVIIPKQNYTSAYENYKVNGVSADIVAVETAAELILYLFGENPGKLRAM